MASDKNTSVEYAFTITLRPKVFIHEPERQYDDACGYVNKKLMALCQDHTLIAELTKNYNVHLHGICRFSLYKKRDCMKDFYSCFRNDNIVGYVNIKQIDNLTNWITYITKDLTKTYNAINRRPIIYDYKEYLTEDQRAQFGCHL